MKQRIKTGKNGMQMECKWIFGLLIYEWGRYNRYDYIIVERNNIIILSRTLYVMAVLLLLK